MGEKGTIEGEREISIGRGDGVVDGDELGAVGEGAFDLDFVEHFGDAGHDLVFAEEVAAEVHEFGDGFSVADEKLTLQHPEIDVPVMKGV